MTFGSYGNFGHRILTTYWHLDETISIPGARGMPVNRKCVFVESFEVAWKQSARLLLL